MSSVVIDSPRGDDWRITIDGKLRVWHYRNDNVLAEHFALVIQENDALRSDLAALRAAAREASDCLHAMLGEAEVGDLSDQMMTDATSARDNLEDVLSEVGDE